MRGKENPLLKKGGKPTSLGTPGILPKTHSPHVLSLVLRCPRSVRLKLSQLVVDHITLFIFVLISACCVDRLDIVLQNVPAKENDCLFTWKTCVWYPCSGRVQCSILRVMVLLSEKSNKIKTRKTSKTLLRFQSRVWRFSSFLTEEPRRPFLDS